MNGKLKSATRASVTKAAGDESHTEAAASHSNISQQTISSAIAAFFTAHVANFDKHGRRILDRLKADDPRVLEIFAAVANNEPGKIGPLLTACVEADLLMRTFNVRLAKERRTPERLNRLKQGIADLRQFLVEFSRPTDPLEPWVVLSDEEILKDRDALDHLELMVETRRQIVVESAPRFGATRKSAITNKQAAETAAIGWIAAAVEDIAGKPLTRHAAVLAEVLFGIRDITNDRTRAALKRRRRNVI